MIVVLAVLLQAEASAPAAALAAPAAQPLAPGPGEAGPGDLQAGDLEAPETPAALAPPADPDDTSPGDPTADDSPRYRLHLEGFDAIGLETSLKVASTLWQGRRKPAATRAQIGRRLSEDLIAASQLLRGAGYYSARISRRVRQAVDDPAVLDVTIAVDPGPRYAFSEVALDVAGDAALGGEVRALFPLKAGDVASTDVVLAAEAELRTLLPQRGYPFVALGQRHFVIDHDSRSATYQLSVDPGPRALFGPLRFAGQPSMRREHMAQLVRFRRGQPFDQRRLDDLRETLILTSGFASVTVAAERPPDDAPRDADGAIEAPIVITTTPAKQRTLSASLGYGTGEGAKSTLGWQHRNLFGGEERLTLDATLATIEQSASSTLELLNFKRRDQSLLFRLIGQRQRPNAFDADSVSFGVSVGRQSGPVLHRKWSGTVGLDLSATRTLDALGRRRFLLLSTPVSVRYDSSNDLFDPVRGWRANGAFSLDAAQESRFFTYGRFDGSLAYYHPLDATARFVAAERLRIGSIVGAGRNSVPATRRFYAGGGGSIRGFGYQDVGPRDEAGQPLGGRSLIELSAELRWRINRSLGLVPFVDAGNVYSGPTPNLGRLRVGAGLGMRYFTTFAPVRLDLATPFNRRPGESRIGVYVSVGQSF